MLNPLSNIRMLFLGDRGIASRVLTMFLKEYRTQGFDIIGIVSSSRFYDEHRPLLGEGACFISNESRNTDFLVKFIENNKINLLMSVQHNWILSRSVLSAAGGVAFNLHNAKLPNYKGFNSISHAIHNGDEDYVSTLHWMSEEVDSGNIAYEEVTKISPIDTAKSLHGKTIEASVRIAGKLFDCLRDKILPPSNPLLCLENGIFYGRESIKNLLEIKLSESPAEINRKVRAAYYPPFNTAYIIVDGLRVNLIPESVVG